ncbi:NUDIX hydrolase [Veronia pacifica]|uniref:Nudix hydrolase domain-containing protein n=1 Tax=Veronia pacifica TaxID=1080227 RepID=A0A1C3ES74_9GAMM|nr:NUDIX domain-containing protein [Veronia pacifica]ODA36112.1 hypothetical protein A8L45_00465 [Veronia pacifica]
MIDQTKLKERKLKVCPVVSREMNGETEVLAFCHPLAGKQLVKGTIEIAESPSDAAIRELYEESGVTVIGAPRFLCHWHAVHQNQEWYFYHCQTEKLVGSWQHFTNDDGGHHFAFFWHRLKQLPDSDWHPVFRDALAEIAKHF